MYNNPLIPGDPYMYNVKWIVSEILKHKTELSNLDEKIRAAVIAALDQHDPIYLESADALINSGIKAGALAYIEGYYAPGDGGANLYITTDDYNDIISADFYITLSGPNMWAIPIILTPFVTPEMFGAKGDGITDDSTAFNKALFYKSILLTKEYYITSDITPTKGTHIYGLVAPKQDDNIYARIILDGEKQFILKNSTNIIIEKIVIQHDPARTNAIIDMASARYIKIADVLFSHNNTTATCNAIDDTVNYGGFSGYIELYNIYATGYKTAIKTRATYIDIIGCTLTGATERAIWKTGGEGIGRIDYCDISKVAGAAEPPIQYDGSYGVFCTGCYFEGYALNNIVLSANSVPIEIKASKFNIFNTSNNSGKYSAFNTGVHPTGGTANASLDLDNNKGESTLENLVLDSALEYESLFWNYGANVSRVADPIGGYKYAFTTTGVGGVYQQIKGPFYAGQYICLHAWVKKNNPNASAPYLHIAEGQKTGISGTDLIQQRFSDTSWTEFIIYGQIANDTDYITVIGYGEFAIAGITLARGINPNAALGAIGQPRVIMAENLIINDNGTYYKLSVDPGTGEVTGTPITSI